MERESNPMEALCRSGCGFYGNPATDGLCSVCFKEALKKKQQPPTTTPSPSAASFVSSAPPAAAPFVSSAPPATPLAAAAPTVPALPQPVTHDDHKLPCVGVYQPPLGQHGGLGRKSFLHWKEGLLCPSSGDVMGRDE
ncbi:unnamed protein product [Plutella xylostella]|uniref:(diamondback moth) hypothetical protein n=1 Tax=Plutella xylostella TaxID=51655 RepID=A0A8S4FY94_PLUXY|nr:unnamed protein product [Plutella xylostella]